MKTETVETRETVKLSKKIGMEIEKMIIEEIGQSREVTLIKPIQLYQKGSSNSKSSCALSAFRKNPLKLSLSLAIMLLVSTSSYAAVSYPYKPGCTIKAQISEKGINRIELGKQQIGEVVGDEANYQLLSDKEGNNIFIIPKVPVGKSFGLSLISTSGDIQDMELKVSKIKSQTILIDMARKDIKQQSRKQELTGVLKAMNSSDVGKYYVQSHHEKIDSAYPELEIYKERTYAYGDITGVILKVRNKSHNTQYELTEEFFSKIFQNPATVTMGIDVLTPGKGTTVYVVVKEKSDV